MVSTTGEHYAYFELDEDLRPAEKELPVSLQRIRRAHPGKLRAGALHGSVHGRRGRISARRRDGKSGKADAFGSRRA